MVLIVDDIYSVTLGMSRVLMYNLLEWFSFQIKYSTKDCNFCRVRVMMRCYKQFRNENTVDKMPPEPTRKPREMPKPYHRKPKNPIVKDAPRTAAKSAKVKKHENLTLHDWMTVYAFIDEHPGLTQGDIVEHFSSK